MKKTILITGSTDGIGLETARKLRANGHTVLVHGRSSSKLEKVAKDLDVETFKADLSSLRDTKKFANTILEKYKSIDVLINNAGVYKTPSVNTNDGYDIRFMVNTFAPYLLAQTLLSILKNGRIINLSSAAQSSVDIEAMLGNVELSDFEAYAQSKLAITMWSRHMAREVGDKGPLIIAVNPGSLLGTKMVKEGFNTSGNDINIGVNILTSLSLDDEHREHHGEYYDNDNQRYASAAADGLDDKKAQKIVEVIKKIIM